MKNSNNIISSLKVVLATSYGLTLKLQNYHWNVTGIGFKSLHELFATQYNELILAIDEIAERIRSLGSKVEANLDYFSKLSEVGKADHSLNSEEMVKDLVEGQSLLINLIKCSITTCQKDGDEATADLLIKRLEVHQKALWMLNSSI